MLECNVGQVNVALKMIVKLTQLGICRFFNFTHNKCYTTHFDSLEKKNPAHYLTKAELQGQCHRCEACL